MTKTTPPIGYFSPLLSFDEIAWRGADLATYLPLFNISRSTGNFIATGVSTDGKFPIEYSL